MRSSPRRAEKPAGPASSAVYPTSGGRREKPLFRPTWLRLVERLGAGIEAAGVAQPGGIGGSEQAKRRVWGDHPILVQQGEATLGFEQALDHEHHVWPAGVVFVEHQGHRPFQGPDQDAGDELGDLTALAQHHHVTPDQVGAGDMAIQVHAHTGPVQARGHLFDVRGLATAVRPVDIDAAIMGETQEDGAAHLRHEAEGRIDFGHMRLGPGKGGHRPGQIEAEGRGTVAD